MEGDGEIECCVTLEKLGFEYVQVWHPCDLLTRGLGLFFFFSSEIFAVGQKRKELTL